jgi:GntR family transcriptional regulator/MocR family aminotransferase
VDIHISLVDRRDVTGEIYRQLRAAILDGRLRPGDRLPPTREVAKRLSVSRTTVMVGYERLAGEGYLTSRVGAGTYVAETVSRTVGRSPRSDARLRPRPFWDTARLPRDLTRPAEFDFRPGVPDAGMLPYPQWRRLLAGELRPETVGNGAYADPRGDPGLRTAVARHFGISRGVDATPEDVLIINSTQQAIDLVARVLLEPGDAVAVEDPGWNPQRRLLTSLGMRVAAVPVDREGIVVDEIPLDTKLVVVSPSHQFPLGMAMSLPRRVALLEWAERSGAAIIEDDYDTEFRFGGRPLDSLQSLDSARHVIYVSSFSKTLLPTLRLAFLVAPPALNIALRKAKFLSDWHTWLPGQRALAKFIEQGLYGRHVRQMRGVYQQRRELIVDILVRDFAEHLDIVPSQAGLHLSAVARSLSATDIDQVVNKAAADGVAVYDLAPFAAGTRTLAGLMLGYGSIELEQIDDGLRRLLRHFPR